MFVAGLTCFLTGIAYYKLTQDCPEGNYKALRAAGKMPGRKQVKGTFVEACKDYRVWVLFLIYGACFGVELTINNVAALYFADYFDLGLKTAGIVAALFGLMNIFARTLGGLHRGPIRGGGRVAGACALAIYGAVCGGDIFDRLFANGSLADGDRDPAVLQSLCANV